MLALAVQRYCGEVSPFKGNPIVAHPPLKHRLLDLDRLPEDSNDYETVGGMFMARLGRILTF